jgi:hypothetical protein
VEYCCAVKYYQNFHVGDHFTLSFSVRKMLALSDFHTIEMFNVGAILRFRYRFEKCIAQISRTPPNPLPFQRLIKQQER